MINTLNKHTLSIAMVLVTAFLTVFACNVFCDQRKVSLEISHEHTSSDSHSLEERHGSHGEFIENHNDETRSNEHSTEDSDECCEALVDPFFDNLVKHKVEVFEFRNIENFEVQYSFVTSTPFILANKTYNLLYFYKHIPPPVYGDQLRILHQSFLL